MSDLNMTNEDEQDPLGIRAELANALSDCEDNCGSFYSFQSLPDAPNPLITTGDYGVVGVPLSDPEGKRLLKSTAPETPVNDTFSLAINSSKMRIRNHKFNGFIHEKIIPAICKTLGVKTRIFNPEAVFEAMFVCTNGSELVPCQSSIPEPDKHFGKLLIVLPSEFTGGALRLSRGGSDDFEAILETESAISTSAVAWFNGVSVTALPILSGYRLVLSYNLVKRSTSTIMPGLDAQREAIESLRRGLLRWKEVKEENRSDYLPDVLYYFSDAIDLRFLNKLSPLMSELGVHLYRAEIKFTRGGSVIEPDDYKSRREKIEYRRRYEDSDDDEDEDDGRYDDVELDEILTEDFSIKKLVALDGTHLDETTGIPFDERETIPMSVLDDFDEPDDQEYGGIWESHWLEQCRVLSFRAGDFAFHGLHPTEGNIPPHLQGIAEPKNELRRVP
ncbi:hypothetical protein SCHPADRAFT_410781 [Schizopora paradoxa]|uniref:Uncharacterized protein n=1 Tax=Schizopora paradoxa TaxID=27342 RepID=A0A0H2RSV8_9AGAM|nr:hypothetical protein SCHPADRAFT_410781 [Schizopora paradoxa]